MWEDRFIFFAKLGNLISVNAERQKNELDPSDPDFIQKRIAINQERTEDLINLRKWYFGKKSEIHCADCDFYYEWEQNICGRK